MIPMNTRLTISAVFPSRGGGRSWFGTVGNRQVPIRSLPSRSQAGLVWWEWWEQGQTLRHGSLHSILAPTRKAVAETVHSEGKHKQNWTPNFFFSPLISEWLSDDRLRLETFYMKSARWKSDWLQGTGGDFVGKSYRNLVCPKKMTMNAKSSNGTMLESWAKKGC